MRDPEVKREARLIRALFGDPSFLVYEVLKPLRDVDNPNPCELDDWEKVGRKYSEKGIASLCHDSKVQNGAEFFFYPSGLWNEIDELICKRRGSYKRKT